jgi:hypothetical protein
MGKEVLAMEVEMEKQSRAANLLSQIYEFGGLTHQQVVEKVVTYIARNMQGHRDLRIPAAIIGKYCQRGGCDVRNLEVMLNQIGWHLVYKHRMDHDDVQAILDELVFKMVAQGRMRHGRL